MKDIAISSCDCCCIEVDVEISDFATIAKKRKDHNADYRNNHWFMCSGIVAFLHCFAFERGE